MSDDDLDTDQNTGLVYLSYIPEGMTPASIRQFFSKYAEIGRIYLEPFKKQEFDPKNSGDAEKLLNSGAANPNSAKSKKKRNSYNSGRFREGWVEFENKKRAIKVARQLNNSEIAEKKHGAWAGQFWSLKYLHKFKWANLTQQLEFERQQRKKQIRETFTTAREEQKEYLKVVAASKKAKSIESRKRKMDLLDLDKESKSDTIPKDKRKAPKQRKTASEYGKSSKTQPEGSRILSKFFG